VSGSSWTDLEREIERIREGHNALIRLLPRDYMLTPAEMDRGALLAIVDGLRAQLAKANNPDLPEDWIAEVSERMGRDET
jgi:hypothetical protein